MHKPSRDIHLLVWFEYTLLLLQVKNSWSSAQRHHFYDTFGHPEEYL